MLTFTVPGAPVGKGRARATTIGGRARLYTPAKTAAYEGLVALAARQAMGDRVPLEGPVAMDVAIWCAVPASWSQRKRRQALEGAIWPATKPDASNIIKAVEDGCNGIVYRDDVQIVSGTFVKRYAEAPCVAVLVRSLAQPLPELAR